MSIAIGVGSRGIVGLAEIVRALAEEIKKLDAKPFIIPAMGSHGERLLWDKKNFT